MPLWGVWADKYSRKAVIVRSALVEAVVFACVALSREPWQLAGSLLLVGFQLGNTGVMLAAIRDVDAAVRGWGRRSRCSGPAGPVGMAIGPGPRRPDRRRPPPGAAGDLLGLGRPCRSGRPCWSTFGSQEVRPAVDPAGRVLSLAFGAVRGVLTDPAIRRVFLIFGVAFLGAQMSRPYLPVLVEHVNGPSTWPARSAS